MKYITADELARMMRSDKVAKRDFVVVDVRDDDYYGGNIKGSLHKPSNEFLANVDALVEETKDIRGPKAARIYEEIRNTKLLHNDIPHEVIVLQEGFTLFQTKFKDDPNLVENWDRQVWASEWS